MKKRSLVAAIAMLIVSAIVLTSSTYAWFASSASASVTGINATVSNNNGSISVAPTGTYAKAAVKDIYKTAITGNDYENLCTNLNPVSMNFTTTPQFNKVNYDTAKFTSFTAGGENSDYLVYQFKVKASNAADASAARTVSMGTSFTTNSGAFCNGIVAVTVNSTTTYYFYNGGGSYEALVAMTAGSTGIEDTNGNAIVDAGDANLVAASDLVQSTSFATAGLVDGPSSISVLTGIAAGAEAEATVTCYVWAEGQDSGCTGNVNAQQAYFTINLA